MRRYAETQCRSLSRIRTQCRSLHCLHPNPSQFDHLFTIFLLWWALHGVKCTENNEWSFVILPSKHCARERALCLYQQVNLPSLKLPCTPKAVLTDGQLVLMCRENALLFVAASLCFNFVCEPKENGEKIVREESHSRRGIVTFAFNIPMCISLICKNPSGSFALFHAGFLQIAPQPWLHKLQRCKCRSSSALSKWYPIWSC